MAEIIPFAFENKTVRVGLTDDGELWFVAPDACRALDMADVTSALRVLDDDEKGPLTVRTPGGPQTVNGISEPGLYKLIARSRKPEARRFDRWVRHEVLPSVRKTGGYGAPDPMTVLNDPAAMRGLLLTYTEKVLALEEEKKVLAPKADALDRIATTAGSLCITDAAKTLQVAPHELFSLLRARSWIYRRAGASSDVAFQIRLNAGVLEHKTATFVRPDGTAKTVTQVRVTPKGLASLAKLLGERRAAA